MERYRLRTPTDRGLWGAVTTNRVKVWRSASSSFLAAVSAARSLHGRRVIAWTAPSGMQPARTATSRRWSRGRARSADRPADRQLANSLSASLATRWMAPRPRSDDSAPFYRCVMRRRSRGHFWRITQPFDRRFPDRAASIGWSPATLLSSLRRLVACWCLRGSCAGVRKRRGFPRRRGSDWSKVLFERDKARTAISRRQLIGEAKKLEACVPIFCMEAARSCRTLRAKGPAPDELCPAVCCHRFARHRRPRA